jgi:putative peptide zinc metalloprotease protein
MRKSLNLLLALLLSLTFGFGVPAWADDDDEGRSKDSSAQAVNEKDGSSVFEFAFDVKRVTDGVVDNQNVAVAYASCESCRAVAISIQIVLVAGGVDVLTPQNLAVAVNEECVSCTSLAYAYQFVFGGGEELVFTRSGRRQLKRLQQEFKRLGKSDVSPEEFNARAKELTDRLRTVLQNELVPRRDSDDDDDDGRDDERGGEPIDEDEREDQATTETTPTETQPTETQPETQPPTTETQPTETAPTTTETTPAP